MHYQMQIHKVKVILFIYLFTAAHFSVQMNCSLHYISNLILNCDSNTSAYDPQKKLTLVINLHILSCHTGIIDSFNFLANSLKTAGKVPTEQHGRILPSY